MKVSYKNFDSSKVICGKKQSKSYKGKDGKSGKYDSIPLAYGNKNSDFHYELPVCNCGSIRYSEEYGRWSVLVELDPSNEKQSKAIKDIKDITRQCVVGLAAEGCLNPKDNAVFRKRSPTDDEVNNIIIKGKKGTTGLFVVPLDEKSFDPIWTEKHKLYCNIKFSPGKNFKDDPQLNCDNVFNKASFVKLSRRKDGTLSKKKLKWSDLESKKMKAIPLIQFTSIYCGTKPSIQFEITSSIVIKLIEDSTIDKQLKDPNDTIKEIEEEGLELDDEESNDEFGSEEEDKIGEED